jgi:hypothetical protein
MHIEGFTLSYLTRNKLLIIKLRISPSSEIFTGTTNPFSNLNFLLFKNMTKFFQFYNLRTSIYFLVRDFTINYSKYSPPHLCVSFHFTRTRGADKSLARPTSRCILFDGQNISFDASLVIYIKSTNIPPIMVINRIYETKKLLSL